MSRKTLGLILLIVGVIVALLSVLADMVGVGMLPGTFGLGQIIGTIVGVAAFVVGLVLLLTGDRTEPI